MDWDAPEIEALITTALSEDVGSGDVTVAAIFSPAAALSGRIVAREDVVCAGLPLAEKILGRLDADVAVELRVAEGQSVLRGAALATVNGNAAAILTGERTLLNLLSDLCGIATLTRKYVRQIEGTRARIRDSRNTIPGLRLLEQYAIRAGGGTHHHAGLFDAIVLTHAHIIAAGGIKAALDQAHSHASRLMNPLELTAYEATGTIPADTDRMSLPIQVEIGNEEELCEALSAGAESILLVDTESQQAARLVAAARGIRPGCLVEMSGDISLTDARTYAETGVDYLAPHALTTAAASAKLQLLVDRRQEK